MTPGRNVYIPNLVFHNYEDAKQYGQLVQLSKGSIDQIDTEEVTKRFREKLAEAHQDDFILMSGSPLLNVIAVGIILDMYGTVNMLQWNGILQEYFKIEFTLEWEIV